MKKAEEQIVFELPIIPFFLLFQYSSFPLIHYHSLFPAA